MSTDLKDMKSIEPQYTCLHDPIIQEMLSLSSLDSIDPNELERINRMASMLRCSKKYKRLSIDAANKLWGSSADESSEVHVTVIHNQRRVTFSDDTQIISSPTVPKPSFFHQIKSQFYKIKRIL